jgi:trimethylamine--corrinoid protein Co-methyltransferase
MAKRGLTRNCAPFKILTDEQVDSIITGTLEVLEETGVRVEHEKALKVFEGNGCGVDYKERMVRIPPWLVEESLRKCPRSFLIKARNPKDNIVMGGNVTCFKNSLGMQTIDLDTWDPRVATRKENYDAITVLDALENIHILGPYTAYFGFEGIPPVMALPESCASKFRNSTKVQMEGYANDSEVFQIQMAKAVGAEILQAVLASPPLTYYREAIEALYRAVDAGFPILVGGGQICGGTGPVTLAGALITNNVEVIVPIVLAQLIQPGSRVVVTDISWPINMRSGSPAFGGIETSLHLVAFNQIWRGYGVPTHNAMCGYVNSKTMDFQAGYEKAIQTVTAALSGANLITLHGGISAELTYHPVQSIIDDDLAGMVKRFLQGIQVNDETMALDLIDRVGPIPGHYLSEEHTRKWWMQEQFIPRVSDRLTYPEWESTGKKSALDYAKERMEEVLASHKPEPLPSSQEEEIERILKEARRFYEKEGKIS